MKKIILSICLTATLMSCEKKEGQPATSNQTPAFSIVGTWVLESAKVTIDGQSLTIPKADITKGGFFRAEGLETTFTADGNYTRDVETGVYVLGIGQIKLGTFTYNSFTSPDLSTFVYGNRWEGSSDAVLQKDAFFVSQKILDNVQATVPTTSKSVTYLFTYKKK